MKLFLAIFTIALVAQVSLGASIPRSKRDADNKKDVYALMKESIPIMRSKLEVIYKEIPDTDAYAKYRQAFEELFKLFDEKNDDELCIEKLMNIFGKINSMKEKSEKDESEEAAKIKEIFVKHKDVEFGKKMEAAFKNATDPDMSDMIETC